MNKFEQFNKAFSGSNYREIRPQYTGDDYKLYQQSKAPINNVLVPYEGIKTTSNRIGWVVPNAFVVVDIDNIKDAKKVYDVLSSLSIKFSYMRSKKGAHFIFKNTRDVGVGAGNICALGIKIDTRSKEKGYIILPHNDTDRKWGNITSDVDDIPYFLMPLEGLKREVGFAGMKDGDGRNTELLKHFLNMKDYGNEITLDEKVEAIRVINKYLFDDSIDEDELNNTVLRDSIVNKEPSKKKNLTDEQIATNIIKDKHIISTNSTIYMYNGKYYKPMLLEELERLIHLEYGNELKKSRRIEIINFIKLKSWVEPNKLNKNWNEIVVKNGILNITNMKLYEHTPEAYNTVYIDYNYKDEPVYSNQIDTFMNFLSDKDIDKKKLLYEIIGYCFVRKTVLSKFFIFYGEGQTGKSTYLKLIEKLVGEDNTSFLNIQDLEDRFLPAEMFSKLVNVGDDLPFKPLGNSNMLKKFVTGEKTTVQEKFGQPFSFNNFAKLLFATNRLPPITDKTSGLYRRLIIVEMNNIINKPDPFFMERLTVDDYEYLLFNAIKAIRGAIMNNSFTETEETKRHLTLFRTEQSSVLMFIEDYGLSQKTCRNEVVTDMYNKYKYYCENEAGFKPLNKINFKREFADELDLDIKNTTFNGENQQWRFV